MVRCGLSVKIDYALIGAASEKEAGIPLLQNEWAVYKNVYVGQHPGHFFAGQDFLVGEARPAPYCLVGILLYKLGQKGEGLCLIEGVSAGEGDVAHLVFQHNLQQFLYAHPLAVINIPGLGIVAAGAMMVAAGTVNGGTETRSVRHCLMQYVKYANFVLCHTTC